MRRRGLEIGKLQITNRNHSSAVMPQRGYMLITLMLGHGLHACAIHAFLQDLAAIPRGLKSCCFLRRIPMPIPSTGKEKDFKGQQIMNATAKNENEGGASSEAARPTCAQPIQHFYKKFLHLPLSRTDVWRRGVEETGKYQQPDGRFLRKARYSWTDPMNREGGFGKAGLDGQGKGFQVSASAGPRNDQR
jgi:hypothetical protein